MVFSKVGASLLARIASTCARSSAMPAAKAGAKWACSIWSKGGKP